MAQKTSILDLVNKPTRVVAGVMSGTSVDAITVAICEISGAGPSTDLIQGAKVKLLALDESPFPSEIRALLFCGLQLKAQQIAELHFSVAELFSMAILKALKCARISADELDLIGSHGQTIYHHSSCPGAKRATLQIGDGDLIAVRCGVPVISDFRAKDIALGGEGAPLTPYTDRVLFYDCNIPNRAVLNLGGIANLSVLDSDPTQVWGFDCGPANCTIDRLASKISDGRFNFDLDAQIGRSGRCIHALLQSLLDVDTFIKAKPPKSSGPEMYGDRFLERAIQSHGKADADLMATLVEFSAKAVAFALKEHLPSTRQVQELIVAGGGAKNPLMLERIQELCAPIKLRSSAEFGIPVEAREALAFAIFANDHIFGLNTSIAKVTGASRAAVLGKLSVP